MLSLHPNDDYGIEECWKEETDILSKNIMDAILFFDKECTDEEFYCLSSIFSDVAQKTQSKNFVRVLRARLNRVQRESYKQESFGTEHMRKYVDFDEYVKEISMEIDYAERVFDEQ